MEDNTPLRNELPTGDELDEPHGAYSIFKEERNMSELFNPIPIFENATGDIPGNPSYRRFSAIIQPDSSNMDASRERQSAIAMERGKRKRDDDLVQSEVKETEGIVTKEAGEGSCSSGRNTKCRGAVGPIPPLAP
jgi:hypothetical protein